MVGPGPKEGSQKWYPFQTPLPRLLLASHGLFSVCSRRLDLPKGWQMDVQKRFKMSWKWGPTQKPWKCGFVHYLLHLGHVRGASKHTFWGLLWVTWVGSPERSTKDPPETHPWRPTCSSWWLRSWFWSAGGVSIWKQNLSKCRLGTHALSLGMPRWTQDGSWRLQDHKNDPKQCSSRPPKWPQTVFLIVDFLLNEAICLKNISKLGTVSVGAKTNFNLYMWFLQYIVGIMRGLQWAYDFSITFHEMEIVLGVMS